MNIAVVLRLLVIALVISTLYACQQDPTAEAISEDVDQIVVRLPDSPESFGPFTSRSNISKQVYMYMYNMLADYDFQTSELKPVLIEALPAVEDMEDGGAIFSMRIKDEAVWEDGSEVTGHDVAWTIKMAIHPNFSNERVKAIYTRVEEVTVDKEDPKSFAIYTSSSQFLEKEIVLGTDVYPKHVFDSTGVLDAYSMSDLRSEGDKLENTAFKKVAEDFSSIAFSKERAGGSGPYYLENYEEGQYIVLRRKADYWGLKYPDIDQLNQYPERFVFRIIPDEATALTLLKNQEIDFIDFSRSSIAQYDDLIQDSTFSNLYDFEQSAISRFVHILLNHEDERLADLNVRKALRHLIDRDRIIDQLAGGYGTKQNGPIHISKPQFNKTIKPDEYDPDRAIELLENAGWNDTDGDGIRDKEINGRSVPLELTWHVSGTSTSIGLSTLATEACKAAGIKITTIEKPNSATFVENINPGDYDIFVILTTQFPLMDDLFPKYHSTSVGGGGNNILRFKNEEVDDLLELIRNTDDVTERQAAYLKVQEILYNEVDAIYLYSPELKFVVDNTIDPVFSSYTPGYFLNSKDK